ncbi:hypothetical protein [Aeromonas hydrophila]|uniref:hypothetical protein n=1 Tax=Aeromonas hydrophila TaxID=644 RepID=UPI0029D935A6|nr:hypothetical protein [Aeromonas hydrophila]MDX7757120.1 hypothetical protein [Aeromonas hydrophila]
MTTLFSWTGIDTHGPASIYIASDSRISWGKGNYWDVGRKVFSSKKHPELFGYSGSVTFPIQMLGQLIEHIDNGLAICQNDNIDKKLESIRSYIESSFNAMPHDQKKPCQILYATRLGNRMSSSFHMAIFDITSGGISCEKMALPEKSGLIVTTGSGKVSFKKWYDTWVGKPDQDPHQTGRTSRAVFSSFCDSLESQKDPFSGGAPQLVGLYREGAAINFGIIYNGKRYFNGSEVTELQNLNLIEWRNSLFERCDGDTMNILDKAQRQPRPKMEMN